MFKVAALLNVAVSAGTTIWFLAGTRSTATVEGALAEHVHELNYLGDIDEICKRSCGYKMMCLMCETG